MPGTPASAWFKEFIKDKVINSLQAHGGLLDHTMTSGDVEAGTIKFPVVTGRSTMYKLTGALQPVPFNSKGLSTIPLIPEDFQATEHWFVQDAYKSGPQQQAALVGLLAGAVRRKRDTMKLDQLPIFHTAAGGLITTIGTGAEVPDILHFEQGRAEIAAFGDQSADGEVFCLIPEMWMTQLKFYKEIADATWVGTENAPFSKVQRMKTKTVQGVHYIAGPDEYFVSPGATELHAWMWHKSALGAELPVNLENAQLNQRIDLEGHPWQADAFLSGAAIGLRPELVKRFHLKKITAPARPA